MHEFKYYNPIVSFTYFIFAIGFSMFMMHPVFLCISFVCAIVCCCFEAGTKKTLRLFITVFPLAIITGIINPLFNHKGATVIAYLPSGNPFTAESVCYGIGAAVMLLSVFFFFFLYNNIITSDKFMYVFGKAIPALSLVISMILRFIPRMGHQAKEIVKAQKAMGKDPSKGNIIVRCRRWIKVLSILVTWSLENSIQVSDSMKSRGYGLPGRTTFYIFRFEKRDAIALIWIIINAVIVFYGICTGNVSYSYFPIININTSVFSVLFYFSYLLLLITPVIIELKEVGRWKALK